MQKMTTALNQHIWTKAPLSSSQTAFHGAASRWCQCTKTHNWVYDAQSEDAWEMETEVLWSDELSFIPLTSCCGNHWGSCSVALSHNNISQLPWSPNGNWNFMFRSVQYKVDYFLIEVWSSILYTHGRITRQWAGPLGTDMQKALPSFLRTAGARETLFFQDFFSFAFCVSLLSWHIFCSFPISSWSFWTLFGRLVSLCCHYASFCGFVSLCG